MARTAEAVTTSGGQFEETRLLRLAEKHTPRRFRRDCAHARHAADAETFLDEQRRDVEARFLEMRRMSDSGCVWIRGFLDPVGGAVAHTALLALAQRCGAGDDRPADRRLADALVELAEHVLDIGGGATTGGHRVPHLQVTTTLDTLLGRDGAAAAELDTGVAVSAATVQRIACAANVARILLDADSAVIDVGRERRLPAPGTRRAVAHRDQGCVWPGCDRPARWTQPHHVIHWTHGGPTRKGNLVSLCARHHWMCHEGGWSVVRVDGQREVRAIPPLPDTAPLIRGPGDVAA